MIKTGLYMNRTNEFEELNGRKASYLTVDDEVIFSLKNYYKLEARGELL